MTNPYTITLIIDLILCIVVSGGFFLHAYNDYKVAREFRYSYPDLSKALRNHALLYLVSGFFCLIVSGVVFGYMM